MSQPEKFIYHLEYLIDFVLLYITTSPKPFPIKKTKQTQCTVNLVAHAVPVLCEIFCVLVYFSLQIYTNNINLATIILTRIEIARFLSPSPAIASRTRAICTRHHGFHALLRADYISIFERRRSIIEMSRICRELFVRYLFSWKALNY